MKFKHDLPISIRPKAAELLEFANGATQCKLKLRNGTIVPNVLLSNSSAIAAIRGYSSLPFDPSEIAEVFQTDEDISPCERRDWLYFDSWQ